MIDRLRKALTTIGLAIGTRKATALMLGIADRTLYVWAGPAHKSGKITKQQMLRALQEVRMVSQELDQRAGQGLELALKLSLLRECTSFGRNSIGVLSISERYFRCQEMVELGWLTFGEAILDKTYFQTTNEGRALIDTAFLNMQLEEGSHVQNV